MADRYLLESGTPDGYTLEEGGGVLILEQIATQTLTQDSRFDNTNGLAYTHVISATIALTQSARFDNSNTLNYAHVVTPGAVALTQSARFDNSNGLAYTHVVTPGEVALTQSARFDNSNTLTYQHIISQDGAEQIISQDGAEQIIVQPMWGRGRKWKTYPKYWWQQDPETIPDDIDLPELEALEEEEKELRLYITELEDDGIADRILTILHAYVEIVKEQAEMKRESVRIQGEREKEKRKHRKNKTISLLLG